MIATEAGPLMVLEYKIERTPTEVRIRETTNPAINPLIKILYL
jgi:hypothetical protein